MSFFKALDQRMGQGNVPRSHPHPQVTGLSLAGCSPAEPASVITGLAKFATKSHQHPGVMPTFSNPRT